jgi:hypothetical protein
MSAEAFAEALDFWRRVRDHAGTAALDLLGGSSTLAEALVAFRLLHHPNDTRGLKKWALIQFRVAGPLRGLTIQ